MKGLNIGTSATDTGSITPFGKGFDCVAYNPTASDINLTGSPDDGTYTALATVTAGEVLNVSDLPRYIKGSAAGVILLASLS